MQTMAQVVSDAFKEAGFDWMEGSLEQLVLEAGPTTRTISVAAEGGPANATPVALLPVLGNKIDIEGTSNISMEARLSQTSRTIWKDIKAWESSATTSSKNMTWSETIQTAITHGSRNWHLNSKLLHRLKTWELKWLRQY